MPTGIQTYNLELHRVEPIDWSDLDLDDDNDYSDSIDIEPHRNEEKYKYTVEYNGYNIEVDRNEYDWNGKHYIQSMIEITRDELTLRDMYRFEPDEYHPDGLITTGLPLDVTSKIDPISAEEKLIIKAKVMSKQIILDALASQFAVKQNELVQYETTVYQPALEGLNKSISDWFGMVLEINPHDIKFKDSTLEIIPINEGGNWPSTINIRKHYSYRDDKDNYYEIDYRSSHNKVDDNNMYYLTTLGKIAQHVNLITENIENEWKPAYKAIYAPHYELISELRTLEQEINTVKRDIHDVVSGIIST